MPKLWDAFAEGTGGQPDHFTIKIWQGTNTEVDPCYSYKGDLQGGTGIIVHRSNK